MHLNTLLYPVLMPIICGIICLAIPDKMKNIARAMALLVTAIVSAASVTIFRSRPLSWPGSHSPVLLVDTLSAFIGIGIAFFALLITIYSLSFITKNIGKYFGYVLITLGAALGAAYANNLIVLLVFWGLLAVTLYLLVNLQETNNASSSAKKALIIVGGTDAFLMFGIGLVWLVTGTFSMDKIRLELKGLLPIIAYISITLASFAKAGVMPFHSWLPDVAEDGPTPVTAYLPASLDKLLGIYLLARVSLHLFVMNSVSNIILSAFGSITIIFAVMLALVQHDFKRLLGYHAVSQVGYMVLGIGTGNPIGIAGALFHMLNNAIYKSGLFLAGGDVEKRTGITDISRLGGLARYMPLTFASFLVASLSISGIPPFNGFVSKWMIYQGVIGGASANNPLWIVWLTCAMFGSALTLASFMKLIHAIFLGRPSKEAAQVKEAPYTMLLPVLTLAVICFVFGLFAFRLPIPLFIAPSLGVPLSYLGSWNPIMATVLIVIGIVGGLLIYYHLRPKGFRAVEPFVGGEAQDGLERVTGAEFYNTIRELKGLESIYEREEGRSGDIYAMARRLILSFTGFLQYLHNGILPTFMVWCLIGMLGMFLVIFLR
jgi:formate hydrogenlyase subunit 3/multisubunit Na+/H+ antiporter MnhD subunit